MTAGAPLDLPTGEPPGPVVGVVSPGELGAAVGAALRRGGARVLATVTGRSDRTTTLATTAGLEVVGDLDEVVGRSAVVISVVPPHQARVVVEDLVARAGRLGVHPLLVDLNAVSPDEVGELAACGAAAGLDLVDGSVSGAPPGPGRPPSRLLLSGARATRVAALPWTDVQVEVVGPVVGAASAAKMCTGAVRKGVTALVVNALLTAAEHDVLGPVEAELRRALGRDPLVEAQLAASKAWRFVPEMEAVADTQAAAGLDPTTYRAIADVFRRTARSPLAQRRPEDVDRSPRPGDVAESAVHRAAVVAGLWPAADPPGGPR